MVERWPLLIRERLNQPSSSQGHPSEPFQSWARPRDIEKRRQAVAVWYTLINFLVFCWPGPGSSDKYEAMGLSMSRVQKDTVYDIMFYSRFRKRRTVQPMKEAIEAFILTSLKDTTATVETNPLLWWVAILIQTEVDGAQSACFADILIDTLGFYAKLEAIDHYSRALLLDHCFRSWCHAPSPLAPKREWIEDVVKMLDKVSIDWIDEDTEPPFYEEDDRNLTPESPGWVACLTHMLPNLENWLGGASAGPMREITTLRRRLSYDRNQEVQVEGVESRGRARYKLLVQIVEGFTTDPWINTCYPVVIATTESLGVAKAKAVKYIENEFGQREDASQWEEIAEDGNMLTIRDVYIDIANDAKVTVWTEET
jgi:hypothetical protein